MMFFTNFVNRLLPAVRADEEEPELIDPQQELRDKCKENNHAKHYVEKFEECQNRVGSKERTSETCVEELIDLLHAIDHCVTESLFSKLK